MADWTIRRILKWTTSDFQDKGIESARLDAEVLVSFALGMSRVSLYMDLDRPLSSEERQSIRDLVIRRRDREPIAYIVGKKSFYKHEFIVSPATLIPRPDTERLVEVALERFSQALSWADICTGSGIVALSIASELKDANMLASDLSTEALAIAKENRSVLNLSERVRFVESDLFERFIDEMRFDAIVSNPPYIRSADMLELSADIQEHEPHMALEGGTDGLDFYRRLATECPRWLNPNGGVAFEIGFDQASDVVELLQNQGFVDIRVDQDLGGNDRVVSAIFPSSR